MLRPEVSMGRPYLEKFADVKWEANEEHLQAWKDGKTGVPIVDAVRLQVRLSRVILIELVSRRA